MGGGVKWYLACEDALVGGQQGQAVETRQQVDAHPRVLSHTEASVVERTSQCQRASARRGRTAAKSSYPQLQF